MAGAEDHDTMSVDAFKEARARGAFALSWQAHGLWYGVPVEIESAMQAGCTVIVNTSRTIIDAARMAYAGTQVIVITASPETLKKRLAGRGRETAMEIESRLARIVDVPVVGQDIWTVENDNTLNDAIDRFVDIVKRVSELR